jgi:predicted glycosyltransferase
MESRTRNHRNRQRGARVLVYSHDTYGLGHLRRSLLIAGGLASTSTVGSVLIVTGSPRTQAFSLPQGCDTVKIPSVTKTPGGRYRARTLSLQTREVLRIRSELIRSSFEAFRPDLILVDHAPVGMLGELRPVLDAVGGQRSPVRLVLGLRDVIDDPASVVDEWSRLGAWPCLESAYDRILVYGDPSVPTTAQELGLSTSFPWKVSHVGYLGRPIRNGQSSAEPMILVTTGGGGDGHDLLRAYAAFLEWLPHPASFQSVVVTGPLMSRTRRQEMISRFRDVPHRVEVLTFTDRLEKLIAGARGVVSMAGYNSVVEVLSAGKPALLVPRERPRLEQRIRAERVAERVPAVEWSPPSQCTPQRIWEFVERALVRADGQAPSVALGGVEAAVLEVLRLLEAGEAYSGAKEGLRVPA